MSKENALTRLQTKLEDLLANKKYYEAHQVYRTLYFRYTIIIPHISIHCPVAATDITFLLPVVEQLQIIWPRKIRRTYRIIRERIKIFPGK